MILALSEVHELLGQGNEDWLQNDAIFEVLLTANHALTILLL